MKLHCRRKDLESFLGHLSHAATVVCQGRTLLRELSSLLAQVRMAHHFIWLNKKARADISWWQIFAGLNSSLCIPITSPSGTVTSDASGSFRCGAFSSF